MTQQPPRLWRAPAKINLTLHVLGRDAAGWHELDSIVAFAGCSDWLGFAPGPKLSLEIAGPTARASGPLQDNLVLRAASALAERAPGLRLGRFSLHKALPVAAGIGGGSSDAAAALRALAHANRLALDDERLRDAAAAIGADVPVCLLPRARLMAGRGERLGPELALAPLFAVLANPGVAVSTAAVFSDLGLSPGAATGATPSPRLAPISAAELAITALKDGRNDLQAAAMRLAPAIGRALDALAAAPGASFARMSGSGATCFALFADRHAAVRAARAIAATHPGWWVRATLLR